MLYNTCLHLMVGLCSDTTDLHLRNAENINVIYTIIDTTRATYFPMAVVNPNRIQLICNFRLFSKLWRLASPNTVLKREGMKGPIIGGTFVTTMQRRDQNLRGPI